MNIRYHHRRENCRSTGSLRFGCSSRNARGQIVNSSGVSSSAGSPSTPTGIEELSVVIVCCAVGHAATKVRPLISRPVPRATLADSGRCAPGRPMRYTHNMPSSRRGRSAGPGATPGKYALFGHQSYQHLLWGHDPWGHRHAHRRTTSTPEQGTLNVPRRDTDPAPVIVRIAHHRGVKADRDVVQKHLAVDRPAIDSHLRPSSSAASSPAGSVTSAPQSLAKWFRVPQGTTTSGMSCSTATAATALTVPSPPAATSAFAPSRTASRARAFAR